MAVIIEIYSFFICYLCSLFLAGRDRRCHPVLIVFMICVFNNLPQTYIREPYTVKRNTSHGPDACGNSRQPGKECAESGEEIDTSPSQKGNKTDKQKQSYSSSKTDEKAKPILRKTIPFSKDTLLRLNSSQIYPLCLLLSAGNQRRNDLLIGTRISSWKEYSMASQIYH